MPKRPTLPSLGGAMKNKQTRRALFLVRMGAVVPRAAAGADRAALSESRVKKGASADAIRSDALGLRPAELVLLQPSNGR